MDMVERVARAICAADDWTARDLDELTRDGRARYAAMARAAIAAMRGPSEKMVKAGIGALAVADYGMPEYGPEDAAEMTFSAMIDAALTSSEKG